MSNDLTKKTKTDLDAPSAAPEATTAPADHLESHTLEGDKKASTDTKPASPAAAPVDLFQASGAADMGVARS